MITFFQKQKKSLVLLLAALIGFSSNQMIAGDQQNKSNNLYGVAMYGAILIGKFVLASTVILGTGLLTGVGVGMANQYYQGRVSEEQLAIDRRNAAAFEERNCNKKDRNFLIEKDQTHKIFLEYMHLYRDCVSGKNFYDKGDCIRFKEIAEQHAKHEGRLIEIQIANTEKS